MMHTHTSSSGSQVRVGVRIRPLASKEIQQGGKSSLTVAPPSVGIGQRQFTYDAVYDSNVSQSELYESVSAPLLKSFLDGYNATIMAYGQTGSGKTFTMGSEAHTEPESYSHTGLIPRFMADFFDGLQKKKELSDQGKDGSATLLEYQLTASFLEVYGEDVFDLLDEDRKSLPLREDSNGGVVISGLTSRPVSDATQALQVLHEGTMNRTTAATLMNLTSSRSHAVFTIYISQIIRSDSCGEVDATTTSRFTFVDLAGSERMKKTGAEGERAREGIKINEGLLALGNVINALADDERLAKEKKVHVPYRQSKLTRLLQDALGGNSQTLFLACISPSDTNASETLSTLHYANRARNIRNAPTKNVDATAAELQRLHALTRVLQCELIKQRFQDISSGEEKIGEIDDEVLKRKDIEEYMQLLNDAVGMAPSMAAMPKMLPTSSSTDTPPADITMKPISHRHQPPATPSHALDATPNKTISERFDDSFLVDVNPDEDMAILDQLLELQRHDHEYGKEKKKDDEKLKQVEGELEKQEYMLLQLRDSLKVYHDMKEKYEALMTEVQHLEAEKASLAEELEKSTVDPSNGCSAAIKRKLEKVELSLARTRIETKKHREKYRKAEEQAKNCRVFERKISSLKQGRVSLLKKQKEDAARYRDITERKTKELMTLKRKERATEQQMSKLETEVQHHKLNLDRRKVFCEKLSEKLKQTEAHLMKLLSMRPRELTERTSLVGRNRRRTSDFVALKENLATEKTFAPTNEEVKSMKFVFDKMVADKVNQESLTLEYEGRVGVYSDTMRKVVAEVKLLNEARKHLQKNQDDISRETVRDHEETVADLELKLELISSELEELKSKLPSNGETAKLDGEEAVKKMMSTMSAPVLRTLLIETFSKFANAEMERQRVVKSSERKDSALMSCESEVETLNNKVATLSKDLSGRRKINQSGEDPLLIIQRLEEEKNFFDSEARLMADKYKDATARAHNLERETKRLGRETDETKELLSLAEASLAKQGAKIDSKETVERLHEIWRELGVDSAVRENSRKEIRSCLEDTCGRKLKEASELKMQTEEEIRNLAENLDTMQAALGISSDSTNNKPGSTLLECLGGLRRQVLQLQPQCQYAVERREKLLKDAADLTQALGLPTDQLSFNLRVLLQQKFSASALLEGADVTKSGRKQRASVMKTVDSLVSELSFLGQSEGLADIAEEEPASESQRSVSDATQVECGPPKSLDSEFLSRCEQDVTELRVKKSETLVRNRELHQEAATLAGEMYLTSDCIVSAVETTLKQRMQALPAWWSKDAAEEVSTAVATYASTVRATTAFSQHLQSIHASLVILADARRSLSTSLGSIVKHAQKTLLDIVGREIDASEAYTSFHDALFRLPALSEDLTNACISEMEALVSGVEAMTQSEIEALTVVWEALNISSAERSDFWGKIEESLGETQANKQNPFDEVHRLCSLAGEGWVLAAVEEATKGYKELDKRLFKLDRIHQEVEKLRSRQDTKSRILSLDSEVRILNEQLSNFEDLKCSKQRLLTKKSDGSKLLKEERFRKQMQGKFTSKLEQLAALLGLWEKEEVATFDPSLLSDDVRMLLENPEKTETWVEQRTKLMPLRTVQKSKTPSRKRPIENSPQQKPIQSRSTIHPSQHKSGMTPPRKRVAHSTSALTQSSRSAPATSRSAPATSRSAPASTTHKLPSHDSKVRQAPKTTDISNKRKPQEQVKASMKPPKMQRTEKDNHSRLPKLLTPQKPTPKKAPEEKRGSRRESSALPPFGRILSEVASPGPGDKENK